MRLDAPFSFAAPSPTRSQVPRSDGASVADAYPGWCGKPHPTLLPS